METFVNINRSAGWDFGGKVQPERRMVNDLRGHFGELLAKAIDQHALDKEVPKGELEMIRQFVAAYAQLDRKGKYRPRGSSGYSVEGGGYDRAPVPLAPLSFKELAPSRAIGLPYVFEHIWDMQATMLQPVGGMDLIARALHEQVRPAVRLSTVVSAIRRTGSGVRIEHGPGSQAIQADYCICTLPIPILKKIPSDFSPAKKAAIGSGLGIYPKREARLRGAALLGNRRFHLRRPRLDRPEE